MEIIVPKIPHHYDNDGEVSDQSNPQVVNRESVLHHDDRYDPVACHGT